MNFMKPDPDWDSPNVPEKVDWNVSKSDAFKSFGAKASLAGKSLVCDTCNGKFPYSPKATTCLLCVEEKRRAPKGARKLMADTCGVKVDAFSHLSDQDIDDILRDAGTKALLNQKL